MAAPDLTARIGSVVLPNPVMTASGTAGHGLEFSDYLDLAGLGAFVAKSLLHEPWTGNPAPRVHATPAGMINSVGLQGPGIPTWIETELSELADAGVRVVVSVWGRSVSDYEQAATLLAPVAEMLTAVEVNVSCPNVEDRSRMFAHSPAATSDAVAACEVAGVPLWAKLSPNVTDLVEIAAAAHSAGAEAVTLVNTLMAMSIDVATRRPRLGAGGGGLSGPAIHPVAVRAVYDCYAALPGLPIVGVGGVATATDAVEMLMAGASAVQVGTASFADPRAPAKVLAGLRRWCRRNGIASVSELIGTAH
jgi:dihydroorotate dehydrogenase (NAD+) catalytic subunit